jgi:ABC-type polysaccharide/polyol phosphate export permease
MGFKKKAGKLKGILGLSIALANASFKIKNEGMYLGFLWYFLSPLIMFIILYFIFSTRTGAGIPFYSLYLLIGIVMYNFFQSNIAESARLIIAENKGLIKSINFPRESIIISNVIKNSFSHVFEMIVFGIMIVFFGANLSGILYYLPIFVFYSLFTLGVSFLMASLSVYFFDLKNIWEFFSRILFFATPIFYSVSSGSTLYYANLFNPLYYFISLARGLIIYNHLELWLALGCILWSLGFFIAGLFVFKKLKSKFAEMI